MCTLKVRVTKEVDRTLTHNIYYLDSLYMNVHIMGNKQDELEDLVHEGLKGIKSPDGKKPMIGI